MIFMQPFDHAWQLLKELPTNSETARYYFQNAKMKQAHNLSPKLNEVPIDELMANLSRSPNSSAGAIHDRFDYRNKQAPFKFADGHMTMAAGQDIRNEGQPQGVALPLQTELHSPYQDPELLQE